MSFIDSDQYITLRRKSFFPKADDLKTSKCTEEQAFAVIKKFDPNVSPGKRLNAGTLNDLFRFDGTEEYILKISTRGIKPALDLHVSDWAMREVSFLGVDVPVPIFTDTSRYLCDFDYQVLPFKRGLRINEFSSEELALFCRDLEKIHQISLNGFGPLNPEPLFYRNSMRPTGLFNSWTDFLNLQLEEHLTYCKNNGFIASDEFDFVNNLFRTLQEFSFNPVLLHGDLSKNNIIKHDKFVFLDWEDCLVGDPVFDLAGWCCFYMPDKYESMIECFYKNSKKPDDFYVKFWIYYLRIALARTVQRHKMQINNDNNNPPPNRRIQLALEKLA